MSYAPQSLKDVRNFLLAQPGLDGLEVGIVGNPATHTYGYHLGRDRLPLNDYSNRLQRDRNGLTDAASGLDIGMFDRLVNLVSYLLDACREGRTTQIRAIAGPHFNGRAYRWDSTSGWEPQLLKKGDDHEWHAHIEWFRDTEYENKLTLFHEFFGFAPDGGDDMFCKFGDVSGKVQAMQFGIIRAGYDLSPVGGADGQYGNGTAAGLAALIGGDGRNYGPLEYDALHAKAYGGAGTPGPEGPQGPKGDPGIAPGSKVTLDGTVMSIQ